MLKRLILLGLLLICTVSTAFAQFTVPAHTGAPVTITVPPAKPRPVIVTKLTIIPTGRPVLVKGN